VEGAKNEAGTVDKEKMIAFFHGARNSVGHLIRPRKLRCREASRPHRNVTDL
jgi:hypothetical protein